MELGSAPRCGPRALPATSPSGPSPRCDWGLESSTRGKPAFLTIPLMVAQRARERAERSSSPFSLSLSLSSGPSVQLVAPPSPSSYSCR